MSELKVSQVEKLAENTFNVSVEGRSACAASVLTIPGLIPLRIMEEKVNKCSADSLSLEQKKLNCTPLSLLT